jgi:hypothetical protein
VNITVFSHGRTKDARDNGLLAIRYYGCCVVELYEHSRTHLALAKDSPEPRAVETPEQGRIVTIPQVGGLHHRYRRQAAYVIDHLNPSFSELRSGK